MGRAMLIIVTGLFVSLGYTFMGMSDQQTLMTNQTVNTATKGMAENLSYTGLQLAINEHSKDNGWTGDPKTIILEKGNVEISYNEPSTDILEITSTAQIDGSGSKHTIISTYDISNKQQLVPDFEGALSNVSGGVDFPYTGNPKVHVNGSDRSGTCSDKPGLTVHDENRADDSDLLDHEGISGNPKVAHSSEIKHDDVMDLIEMLSPIAMPVTDKADIETSSPTNPGVFSVEGQVTLTGNVTGYGIMIVRNNAELNINADLSTGGTFEFNGLVIFENETSFKATGTADIFGSIMTVSDTGTTLTFQDNGDFNAQYDCQAKDYADLAVDNNLNTTLYRQINIYHGS